MENMRFYLMQIALETFRLEIQRGNNSIDFFKIYEYLKSEMEGLPKVDTRPTAQEYFNDKTN